MKKTMMMTAAVAALAGCTTLQQHHHHSDKNAYARPPFYAKYLVPGNPQDVQIQHDVDLLRLHPRSAATHNDLGMLLVQKGFPKDAAVEFERAVAADHRFYPAWYNLGLVRASMDDYAGARYAFSRTIHFKPGHSAALFQLGLMEERNLDTENAIEHYAKAFAINRSLLDVQVNPRVLDSKLIDLALLRMYKTEHVRQSMSFQPTPSNYSDRQLEPTLQDTTSPTISPAMPNTDPSTQHFGPSTTTPAPATTTPRPTTSPNNRPATTPVPTFRPAPASATPAPAAKPAQPAPPATTTQPATSTQPAATSTQPTLGTFKPPQG